ncbi:MAG: curli production assembly/transport component csgg [Caulobacteraceae bacterium]|nr:curli production assembly/transport component csgg [Caulobacteraceae bacterium]
MQFKVIHFIAPCALALSAVPAAAQFRNSAPAPTDVPHCAKPIGTASIAPPRREWWTQYGLSSPEQLIKLMASQSNCLRIVDRGAGLQMRGVERDLGGTGELQRNSNVGAGQIKAADYTIVPDVADANANQGGGGAALGGLLGSRAGPMGAILGGVRTQQATARALLTLVNVRTTEQEFVAEGVASKTNISFAGGGFGGLLGGIGGGYSNTPIGQVIAQAYLTAFTSLVAYMQTAQPGAAEASAPVQSYVVKTPITMRAGPLVSAKVLRSFVVGDTVYPTGQKNGIWWEVDDETGNRGWVTSVQLGPK